MNRHGAVVPVLNHVYVCTLNGTATVLEMLRGGIIIQSGNDAHLKAMAEHIAGNEAYICPHDEPRSQTYRYEEYFISSTQQVCLLKVITQLLKIWLY